VTYAPWPTWDEAKLSVSMITVAVQVNGKMRGKVEVAAEASQEDVLAEARTLDNVARNLEGKTVRREIYVPGRLVNFVVS